MDSPRLPRFERALTIAPIELTGRDRRIIQMVHKHRFLRSSHIVALIGESSQQVLRRLQLLYHHGFLERPRAQIDYYHKGGSHHLVYGLGNKGAVVLEREHGLALHEFHCGAKNRSVGRVFLEHALLVSDVMVGFELACRGNGHIRMLVDDQLPLPAEVGKPRQALQWKVNLNRSLKLGVKPDRVFALDYTDPAGNRDRAFFFLEADRGTMPIQRRDLVQTSFYRKLLAYEATWSQSIHRARFGFHRFRVLTVTTIVGRVRSLVEACSQLKSGHGLFLFADWTALKAPADVFSSLWYSGKHGESANLLE